MEKINSKPMAKPVSNYSESYAKPTAQTNSSYPFKIGQGVRHAKFGEGVVVTYEGNAANLVIKINFGREGLKTLAMEYAKLEKI